MFDLNLNLGNLNKEIKKLDEGNVYETLVIGGGPAGLTSAIYLKRKGVDVGIIAKKIGGQVMDTTSVENYTGFENITGEDLSNNFKNHALSLNIPLKDGYDITKVSKDKVFTITTEDNTEYTAKSIIIATGSKPRNLDIPGEKEYYGKGVTYCAICDGPLFTGRDVVVAGGGNSAVESAIDLSKIANSVTIVHRSDFRADKILLDKMNGISNIKTLLNTQIIEIKGNKLVEEVVVLDRKSNSKSTIKTNGVFVEIGYLPNSDIFKDIVKTNDRNEIIVNEKCETSEDGVFAAGDVTTVAYKQIVIAAGEGSKAALSANDYLNKLN